MIDFSTYLRKSSTLPSQTEVKRATTGIQKRVAKKEKRLLYLIHVSGVGQEALHHLLYLGVLKHLLHHRGVQKAPSATQHPQIREAQSGQPAQVRKTSPCCSRSGNRRRSLPTSRSSPRRCNHHGPRETIRHRGMPLQPFIGTAEQPYYTCSHRIETNRQQQEPILFLPAVILPHCWTVPRSMDTLWEQISTCTHFISFQSHL